MSDSKLESFKVADRHKPPLQKAMKGNAKDRAGKAAGQPAEEARTLGFARIEAILDQENPSTVQQGLAQLVDRLDALAQKGDSQKERGQAKRGKLAVEHTLELLTYLFATKQNMLQAIAQSGDQGAGKSKRTGARKGDK